MSGRHKGNRLLSTTKLLVLKPPKHCVMFYYDDPVPATVGFECARLSCKVSGGD